MGQHQTQRQLLYNFSFPGSQGNSRETWWLDKSGYRPGKRSIRNIGIFEVACSEEVDKYITARENKFADALRKFGRGEFTSTDAGRDVYDFVALHYVRSEGFRLQIRYLVEQCASDSRLTREQATAEYGRLTSHQDVETFGALVDSVASVLTHYVLYPVILTGPNSFITSNKIMNAAKAPTLEAETVVWFPVAPNMGLWIMSDDLAGQILGPMAIDGQRGRIDPIEHPESPILRCQEPSPQTGSVDFVNTLNGMMVPGSQELYGLNRADIDSALHNADRPAGYRYVPTKDS